MEESKSSSIYHALQTSLRISNWHGVSSQVNFVWSHAIDDASDSEDFIPTRRSLPTASTERRTRQFQFDIRRRFTWNFAYEIPKMGGNLAKLKDGWGIRRRSQPARRQWFHLNYNFEGDYSGAGEGSSAGCGRADSLWQLAV